MRITVTGATGLIGSRLVARLRERGDDVTVLSRDADRASEALGVPAVAWDPMTEDAPSDALAGRDGVVHLAGENIAQRWTGSAKQRIRESRVVGTGALVEGLRSAEPRPEVLVSSSAVGIYGDRGDEQLDETSSPGDDFLAGVARSWEAAASGAEAMGMRLVWLRTGMVLDADGGALRKMLPFFRAGLGGPVAGGDQWVAWIHLDDLVGVVVEALGDPRWRGPVNATAPEPVTNRELSKTLGRVLKRPAFAPVPGFAVQLLYGEMAQVVTDGQRAIPAQATELGYPFRHPELDEALQAALGER
jgi:uncharacterized protein